MELLILKIVALCRPLVSMQYAEAVYTILGVGLFGVAVGALLIYSAVRQSFRVSAVDLMIVAFTVWCVSISLIYYGSGKFSDLVKLLIPLLTYTAAKNVIRDRGQYMSVVRWIIVGFSIPTLLSAVLIAIKSPTAAAVVIYWTGVTRWQGAYDGPHNFGHSMTLFLVTLVLYLTLDRLDTDNQKVKVRPIHSLILVSGGAALYCLYMSQVRSAIVGLITFLFVGLLLHNKKLLAFATVGFIGVAVLTSAYWIPALVPEEGAIEKGVEVTAMDMGSGRPRIWLSDIRTFQAQPMDRKIAGVGVGAGELEYGHEIVGHNDWLQILTQTGLVGFALFLLLQVTIYKAIQRLQGKERYAFLALFVAVNVMMLVSNSYAWRIQVGQLYYMILAFIEIRPDRVIPEQAIVSPVRS
jgi:O-antigen ligase